MKEGEPIYAERLRLVVRGISQSLPIGVLLSTLLVIVFAATSAQQLTAVSAATGHDVQILAPHVSWYGLITWYVAFLLGRILLVLYTRNLLHPVFGFDQMTRITRRLAAGKCYEGIVWGALSWIIVQETSPPAATGMLLGVMAAISSNAVSQLAPIRSLYVALMLPALLIMACRFLSMDGLIYRAMGVCCLLYTVAQYGQARLIGRGLSESIKLRFENLSLIQRLETEKMAADVAKEQAEQADQAKSRFLAAASHDLRQPVHALGLFLEALSFGPAGTAQKDILDHAKAASLASTEMLDTLLDFSRIEAGVIQPKYTAFPIQAILHKLERELAPQADAKGLIYRCRDSEASVLTDPVLLELILRNLINNAIRYTEHGGVLIGCRQRGHQLSIEIFDTGVGIASDQQREVFREFHQLGNPERDRRKGLGLGLAIVDGLARSLHHPLSLSSTPGRGSVFRLLLPLVPLQAPAEVTRHVLTVPAVTLAGRRFLVIDDDEAVRRAMQTLLTHWGCTSFAAENLDEAQAWGTLPPDAILCDYRLRERQTGTEVIAQLRNYYGHPVPALLITGDTAADRLRETVHSDIALIHKPVEPGKLWHALVKLLTDNAATREA